MEVGLEAPGLDLQVLGLERIEGQRQALDLDRRVLAEGNRQEERRDLAERRSRQEARARAELAEVELRLLRFGALAVLVPVGLGAAVGLEVLAELRRELRGDTQRDLVRNGPGIDRVRPEVLLRVAAERHGLALLHDLVAFGREAVAVAAEGLAERRELRVDQVTGLAGRLVLASEGRQRAGGARKKDAREHREER